MSRTLIIGDVHGCFDELQDLLDKCRVTSSDRVISLGDLVDRGPKVRETVDYFMALDKPDARSMVLGNHEERQVRYYLEWQRAGSPTRPEDMVGAMHFKTDYHKDTFISLGPQHFEWFKTLPKFMRLPEYTAPDGCPVSLVHAGCLPDVPFEYQDDFMLMHISDIMPRFVGLDLEKGVQHGYWPPLVNSWWTAKSPPGARFWASLYDGSLGHVVFGHSGFANPACFPHATGIDTGGCFGRTLTALILPEWRLVSVPARATYRSSGRVKQYEVHPGIWVYS